MASDVVAVSFDEETKTAVHVWTARGVKSLNRKNKLSSRAFQSPETPAPFGQHGFRFILLRGVVKASDPVNDPVSLFLELHGDGPVPARMRVEAVARDVEGTEIKREETHVAFDESVRAVDFKTFIGGEAFNGLADDALVFEVTLQFEQSLASGIWASAAGVGKSFWGGAARALSTVAESGVAIFAHRAAMEGRTEEAAPAAAAPSANACPWDDVPPKWQEREERWRFLLHEYLPQNEATFTRGPREFTSSEELLLTQAGLSVKACLRAAEAFDADRDIHERLITTGSHTLRGMRFEVVPAKVTEEVFWFNYFWRVECLRMCATDEQSKVVLSVLDAPVAGEVDATPRRGAGSGANGAANGDVKSSPAAGSTNAHGDDDADAALEALAVVRDARGMCEELLADEFSDTDIVQAAGHSLRQALLALEGADEEEIAACEAVLERLDVAVQTATAAPSTPAVPEPPAVPAAEAPPAEANPAEATAEAEAETETSVAADDAAASDVPAEAPTSPEKADVAAESPPSSPTGPAVAAAADEETESATSPVGAEDSKPMLEASPAARSSAGSAVLMPWEEEDD